MSDPANPYRAPGADVNVPDAVNRGGSIEATLAGHGELGIGATMGEAWERTKGSKTIIFGGFIVAYLILLPLQFAAQKVLPMPQGAQDFETADISAFVAAWLVNLFITFLGYPLFAGVFITGARHASGLPIRFSELFSQYRQMPTFILVSLLQTLLIVLGFVLLILPGIYLSVAYMLAFPLIADRGMGAWEALETSRKLVTKHWFTVFGLMLLVGVLTGLSAVLFLIPLIWTIPWMVLCMGIVYRNLAGLQAR